MGNNYMQVQIYDSIFDLGYPEIKLEIDLTLLKGVTGGKNFYKSEFAFIECLFFFLISFFYLYAKF